MVDEAVRTAQSRLLHRDSTGRVAACRELLKFAVGPHDRIRVNERVNFDSEPTFPAGVVSIFVGHKMMRVPDKFSLDLQKDLIVP